MATTTLRLADRDRGFPGTAPGGIAAGRPARRTGPAAEVAVGLGRQVPTDEPLGLSGDDDLLELRVGDDATVARRSPVDDDCGVPLGAATRRAHWERDG